MQTYHPFLLERVRADGVLQVADLFGADEQAVTVCVLHAELVQSALLLSEERLTQARLSWWQHTLWAEPQRHPLTAQALAPLLAQQCGPLRALLGALDAVAHWNTPASSAELWQQSLQLATPLAALAGSNADVLAAHGLLQRLRSGPAGPHNPGLCPLDLRARHQVTELPELAQWSLPLRRDWLEGIVSRLQAASTEAGGRFERAQRALLLREFRLGSRRSGWHPRRAGRGLAALWTAWKAARG